MQFSFTLVTAGILAAAVCALSGLSAFVAWTLRGKRAAQDRDDTVDEWQTRLNREIREKQTLSKDNAALKAAADTERRQSEKLKEGAVARSTEVQSLRDDVAALTENLRAVTAERDQHAKSLAGIQSNVTHAEARAADLEAEFGKSREYYKKQLMDEVAARKDLEQALARESAGSEEYQSELAAVRSELVSVNNTLIAAQIRLDSLEALEQQVIALEADNAQLKHDREVAQEELSDAHEAAAALARVQEENQELARHIQSLEAARADEQTSDPISLAPEGDVSLEARSGAEDVSETLRVKLNDFQTRLAEMQNEHLQAGNPHGSASSQLPPFGIERPDGVTDDLTQIVGIGKVFESMLHRLGVYYYQQIAAFGPAELARINSELNEFKGRIEHDDWVGQARRLHEERYGNRADRRNVQ